MKGERISIYPSPTVKVVDLGKHQTVLCASVDPLKSSFVHEDLEEHDYAW